MTATKKPRKMRRTFAKKEAPKIDNDSHILMSFTVKHWLKCPKCLNSFNRNIDVLAADMDSALKQSLSKSSLCSRCRTSSLPIRAGIGGKIALASQLIFLI